MRGGINRKTLAVDTINKINDCYNHYETQSNRQSKKNNGAAGAPKYRCGIGSITHEPKALTSATKAVQYEA